MNKQLSLFPSTEAVPASVEIIKISTPLSPPVRPELENKELTAEQWLREYYRMPEPLHLGDTVQLQNGRIGILKSFQYQNETKLPKHFDAIDWNSPSAIPGARIAEVEVDKETISIYSYQLKKIKSAEVKTITTVEDKGTSDNPPEEFTHRTLNEGDVVRWVKSATLVKVEWIATNNSIAMVREISTKKAHNVPPSELKELAPDAFKKGRILSFHMTTKLSKEMGVADPFLSGVKICTRRFLAEKTAEGYQRDFELGQTLQAYSSLPRNVDMNPHKLADVRITRAPYIEKLGEMTPADLEAEGDLWGSVEEFIRFVCEGKYEPEKEVWVIWFEIVKTEERNDRDILPF